jgi:hypothetical protein
MRIEPTNHLLDLLSNCVGIILEQLFVILFSAKYLGIYALELAIGVALVSALVEVDE